MDDPFSQMRDPTKRADRYQKVAGEYYELAKEGSSPFLRACTFSVSPRSTGCEHRAN